MNSYLILYSDGTYEIIKTEKLDYNTIPADCTVLENVF